MGLEAATKTLGKTLEEGIYATLRKHKYHLVGNHSAVKRCNWLYRSLVDGKPCYKERFYGIESHRCIQMTPTVLQCDLQCLHCWRIQPSDIGLSWNQLGRDSWDPPGQIIEGSIREQRRILSGYRDLVLKNRVDPRRLSEAHDPRHVAVSLSGEPTLYPQLEELLLGYRKRGFTTFLVSNGTYPEIISRLGNISTQLYVTLIASDEESFTRITRPLIRNAWQRLLSTLELLPSLNSRCRTVVRLTLAKNHNMERIDLYSRLIRLASPMFVEAKAYMHVGFSQRRMEKVDMPSHQEIRSFSEKLSKYSGYKLVDEVEDSRVVLLARDEEAARNRWIGR